MPRNLIPIFVSVGRPFRPEHAVLLKIIGDAMQANGLQPHLLPRDQWEEENPLKAIQALMKRCLGVLVITYPRIHYEQGSEWPDSPGQVALGPRDVPTVWNQIEATMASDLNLPMLVLVEERIHPEGVINPKHQEYSAIFYRLAECQGTLPTAVQEAIEDFAHRVKRYAGQQGGTAPLDHP